MSLVLLGVDFRRAPLDVRAGLSYDDPAIAALLAEARRIDGLREAVVLSTCNRTEFYLVTAPRSDAADAFLHLLRRDRAEARPDRAVCALVRHEGRDAAAHLFAVAAGLDSALLGDGHVAGQVKRAYRQACEAGSVRAVLHRTFQQALQVARRVRRETTLGHGNVSIGAVVRQVLAAEGRSDLRVTVIGTGEVATDVSRHLAKHGLGRLTVVSRDLTRAAALAAHVGGVAVARVAVEEWLGNADVVIGATASSTPLVTAAMVAGLATKPVLMCDLGVPRNVAADVPVRVLTIDDIRARRDAALALREAGVPAASALVADAADAWVAWRRERAIVPAITALYADEQVTRLDTIAQLAGLAGGAPCGLEARLRTSGRRRVHERVMALRAEAARATPSAFMGAVG